MKYAGVLLPLLLACPSAHAQAFPTKPIRWVIGFAPGGGADILARTMTPKLGEALGQQVVVDNRPGAAGNIAAEHVAKSTADGYTLLMGSPGLASNPSLYAKLGYDPLKDFAPVSVVGVVPILMVVHPSVPANSVKQFVALARARAGALNYASPGTGTSLHLAAELFKSMTRVQVVHVAYKGGAPAIADVMGGHVDLMFDVLAASMPYVKAGRLRALAITDDKRSTLLPDVPTMAESGLQGYRAVTWNGMLAPAGTPREVVTRLHAAIVLVLQSTDMKERFAAIATDPVGTSPEQFSVFLRDELTKWAKVIREAGIRIE